MYEQFKFEITKMDDQALNDDPQQEVARLLRKVADQVESGREYGSIMDYNGSKVGEWHFTEEN